MFGEPVVLYPKPDEVLVWVSTDHPHKDRVRIRYKFDCSCSFNPLGVQGGVIPGFKVTQEESDEVVMHLRKVCDEVRQA